MSEDRSNRKTLLGLVASRSGDKTIKVNYQYTVPHPVYGQGSEAPYRPARA
jgi:ribosomal protein S17